MQLQPHEYANIFPMMNANDMRSLLDDMKANGYDKSAPIVLYENKILDGRNRYAAASQLGIEPTFADFQGDDALKFVIRHNLNRRHLSETQRGVIATKLETMKWGDNQHTKTGHANLHVLEIPNMPEPIIQVNRKEAAEMMNVSPRTIATISAIEKAAPELVDKMLAGELSAHAAYQQVKISRDEAAKMAGVSAKDMAKIDQIEKAAPELMMKLESGEMTLSKAITEVRRAEVVANLESVETKEAKAILGVYDVIVIDYPWPMEKIEREVAPNQVAFEYPTMSLDEITELEIPTADDCHIFMWTTQKFLPFTLDLVKQKGYKYVLTMVWHKNGGYQPFGLPQYNCEFAVYARKGTPKFIEFTDFMTCFNAKRGEHSEKPEEFYATLRRVTAGRRLDMFNRRAIEGFDTWGKEAANE
jgi:N6-adenosine-specific RNA methylase IME4